MDELSLDRAFKAKLDANYDFQAWLLSHTKFAKRELTLSVDEVWHQRWWRDPETKKDSETDIFLLFTDRPTGERVALHIENKLAKSVWTPSQAQNYEKRAIARKRSYKYNDYQTVLIAPQSFVSAWPDEVSFFNVVIFHEDIAAFVPEFAECLIS
jgi:hypothetical protein